MSFTISQNLFVGDSTVITVVKRDEDAVNMRHLQPLLDSADHVLGVSATYGKKCQLSSIAFSTLSRVLVVTVPARHIPQPNDDTKKQRVSESRHLIQEQLLLNPRLQKYAFKMDQIAIALHMDLSVRVNNAVDMLSVTIKDSRDSLEALMNAMGGETHLRKMNVKALFFNTSPSGKVDPAAVVAQQAWAACRAATLPHIFSRFETLRRIDTVTFPKAHLDAVANISRHADRLDALKPTFVKNDTRDQFTVKKDAIELTCGRFPTRIRKSNHQVIRIEIEGKKVNSQVTGRAHKVDGRSARISIDGPVKSGKILSVTTVGKDDPTCAESTRQAIILKSLQQDTTILSNLFFQALWLPRELAWPKSKSWREAIPVYCNIQLNDSQYKAVQRILSDKSRDRIVIIQGPPGTGKTTVIAASVISHHHAKSSQCIWVAAQSNVAVKNVAEKFIKEGFLGFKILVSKDFHYDWHEHLYKEQLELCLIRSDNFKMSVVEAARQLLDCKVILCTLSMFSNPYIGVFLRIVPVQTIILDEASQIECGDYLPIFHRFHSTLSKLVFIGDDKQLPPYGSEEIQELRSVFEFSHLRRQAWFLDTQYRMPHVIGTFISRNVYEGKLRTDHNLTNQACRFIDVNKGREATGGRSWINEEEARVVVKLARLYESRNKSFRIITPYDAQRSLIESLLKRENLGWEDKVFNVDSFQGNEDDYIIISVVRSEKPGFLRNERRMNVMLTRCKRGMVICSSRAFLLGTASGTLVGKLAAKQQSWVNGRDVVCDRVGLSAFE